MSRESPSARLKRSKLSLIGLYPGSISHSQCVYGLHGPIKQVSAVGLDGMQGGGQSIRQGRRLSQLHEQQVEGAMHSIC